MLEWPLINTIVGGSVSTVVAFLFAKHWYQKAAMKEMDARMLEVERKQILTDLVAPSLWEAAQASLVKTLTHDHAPVADKLMEKLGPPCTLTDAEEADLIVALKGRENDPKAGPAERVAAKALPLVMELVKIEAANAAQPDTMTEVKPVAFVVQVAPKEEA